MFRLLLGIFFSVVIASIAIGETKYTYYENGQIMEEKNYKDGKLDGKLTYWNEDGTINRVLDWPGYQVTSTDNSFIGIKLVENMCFVSLSSIKDGFSVDMQLTCDANGQNCYKINSLSCQGKLKTPATPTGCPGGGHCASLASCSTSMPGMLWDIPSLLETEGCNTYKD